MRSPSGGAVGSTRGRAPVEISTTSASSRWPASPDRSATTVCGPSSRPAACTTVTFSWSSRRSTSADWARASAFTRVFTAARSTVTADDASAPAPPATPAPSAAPAKRRPSSPDPSTSVITSAVAISVLLGTQSVSTAEPPMPSRSTTVTSAPS
jgi:hypothetical protein